MQESYSPTAMYNTYNTRTQCEHRHIGEATARTGKDQRQGKQKGYAE